MRAETRRLSRALVVVVGVVAFGLALVPGVGALLPVGAAVAAVGNDYVLLGTFGGIAMAVLGWMVARRATERVDQATPPDPETVPDAPRPGDRADDLLAKWPGGLSADDRTYLRDRLRTDAVYHEMRAGADRATARERVDSGAWTDDPVAARFLRRESPTPPVSERLRFLLEGDSWTQHAARRTARLLADGGDRK